MFHNLNCGVLTSDLYLIWVVQFKRCTRGWFGVVWWLAPLTRNHWISVRLEPHQMSPLFSWTYPLTSMP